MIHSKIRKRYNICLKDGLSEEYAQRSGLEGFFQLNALLCYFNTTILPVDLLEHNILCLKSGVQDKVKQRYFFIPIYNVAQTDRCSCLKQVATTTKRTQLEIFLFQRLLCIRLHNLYYRVVSDTFLQVNLCTLQNIREKHV